jgi:hypothetical protein
MSVFDYSPEFMKEVTYSPKDEELGDIRAPGPVGSVGGFAGRMIRKNIADPLRGMYRSVQKAQEGGFKDPEEMVKAGMEFAGNLAGTPGGKGGLGSGWRSRTLETIEKNPKMPSSASPQTWLSKLRGAGLPKDETMVAEKFLGQASPGGKLSREQVADALSTKLPELGVTKTTLGGAEWEAGQKRLDKLGPILQDAHNNLNNLRGNTAVKQADSTISTYRNLLDEHSKLSQEVAGKRPSWPTYNIEGLKDYKEEYFHAPLKEGGTYRNADMELHHPQNPDNLLYIKHSGTLDLPDGKKSTHLSTLQNDHAAEFDKYKGKAGEPVYIREGMQGDLHPTPIRNLTHYGNERDGFGVMDATTGQALSEGYMTREELARHIAENTGEQNAVPEPIMLNTWWKHGLKGSIKDAVKAGHDYFTWDPAETQMKRFAGTGEDAAQYMKNHYDNNIPGFLKKEYGVEAKKVELGETKKIYKSPYAGFSAQSEDIRVAPNHSSMQLENGAPSFTIERRTGYGWEDAREQIFHTQEEAQSWIDHNTKGGGKEVWQIPITEEIKKKVQEGQFWSKAAKPGGNHAESVA